MNDFQYFQFCFNVTDARIYFYIQKEVSPQENPEINENLFKKDIEYFNI